MIYQLTIIASQAEIKGGNNRASSIHRQLHILDRIRLRRKTGREREREGEREREREREREGGEGQEPREKRKVFEVYNSSIFFLFLLGRGSKKLICIIILCYRLNLWRSVSCSITHLWGSLFSCVTFCSCIRVSAKARRFYRKFRFPIRDAIYNTCVHYLYQ